MGFSSTGEVCNYAQTHRISWADVCEASSKVRESLAATAVRVHCLGRPGSFADAHS